VTPGPNPDAGHRPARLGASVDGERVGRYVGEALVMSTPTGCTAGTLSAGGPIMSPAPQTLLIAPCAPHAPLNRYLVVAATDRVRTDVLPGSSPLVIAHDGAHTEVTSGARLTAARSPDPSLLVRNARPHRRNRPLRRRCGGHWPTGPWTPWTLLRR
jgi:NAD+ kinase